jgi:outer membrane protein assembly factor BamB
VETGFATSHGPSLGSDGLGFFGNWNGRALYKFDYQTGQVLGTFAAIEFVISTPAIGSNGEVFFRTEGASGRFFGLDPVLMDYDWFSPVENFAGSPTLGPEGDMVIASGIGNCYRFSPNGSKVWTRPGIGTSTGTVVFTRDDLKVVVSNGTRVSALNWSDGTVAWSTDLGSVPAAPGVSLSGVVVVGRAHGVINGLDPGDGHVLWSFAALGGFQAAPAFDGDAAYLCSLDARLYRINTLTGHRDWSFTSSDFIPSPPSVGFDGRIYFHNITGNLYSVSPAGQQVWMVPLGGESRGPMSIGTDGTLYVCRSNASNAGESGLAIIRQTPGSVSGKLVFKDFVGTPPSSATFQLRIRGTSTIVATSTASISPTGDFNASFPIAYVSSGSGANGAYTISVKVRTWLRRTPNVDLNTGQASNLLFTLTNGDVNGDNVVGAADLGAVKLAFGTISTDPTWNPNADVNGDGIVGAADLGIVKRNFGQAGDN